MTCFFIDIDPNEIAYKGYVDAAIANNRGDIDISQYPTVDYVEERLDEKADKTEVDGLTDRVTEGEAEQDTLKAKVNALEGALGEHRLRSSLGLKTTSGRVSSALKTM